MVKTVLNTIKKSLIRLTRTRVPTVERRLDRTVADARVHRPTGEEPDRDHQESGTRHQIRDDRAIP